jgi:hypothetical protein
MTVEIEANKSEEFDRFTTNNLVNELALRASVCFGLNLFESDEVIKEERKQSFNRCKHELQRRIYLLEQKSK